MSFGHQPGHTGFMSAMQAFLSSRNAGQQQDALGAPKSAHVGSLSVTAASGKPQRPFSLQEVGSPSARHGNPSSSSGSGGAMDWPMPVLPSPNQHVRGGEPVTRGSVPPPSPSRGSNTLKITIPRETPSPTDNFSTSPSATPLASRMAPPLSPNAAAVRAIMLQSPAFARPRNSPTPGPRFSQAPGDEPSSSHGRSDGSAEIILPVYSSSDLPDGWDEREMESPSNSAYLDKVWSSSRDAKGIDRPSPSTRPNASSILSLHPHSPKGPPVSTSSPKGPPASTSGTGSHTSNSRLSSGGTATVSPTGLTRGGSSDPPSSPVPLTPGASGLGARVASNHGSLSAGQQVQQQQPVLVLIQARGAIH